jgi:hypothetical protein
VDRDRFLLWLMGLAPVMRVRGHGDFVTFEYHSRLKNLPLAAVAAFAKKEAAPTTRLHIVNLASLESLDSPADTFLRGLRRQGASSLWRAKAKPLGPILTRKACEKCGAAACHGVGTEKEQKQHKEKRS